ncbi:MAG: circularly permuted type 2 ATP-grasp protein, partial [Deltaproteobacteria bacterium]|nr:circularly permuted type 2 ATP-grasp protein [Deltaproteobacteria bacterium]
MKFDGYDTEGFYDEMIMPDGRPRPGAALLKERIESLSDGDLKRRQVAAEAAFMNRGVTFNVYGRDEGRERIIPFDIVPRIIEASEWGRVERGLKQRVQALNSFINDVYHDQKILKDRIIPADLVTSARSFRPPCIGLDPPRAVWCHVTGTDLVRDKDGQIYVLEDNLRCPSGVSYVLENRTVMKRTFPEVFESSLTRPIADYPSRLLQMLHYVAPKTIEVPTIAVLTPGIHNSAYFEHSFLAQQMGVELVEG